MAYRSAAHFCLAVIAWFAIALAARLNAADEPPRLLLDLAARPVTIVCLGDSVTGVYYHTGGRQAYPEVLEIALRKAVPNAQVKVINAGISGHSTTEGLDRLDRDVLVHKPDLVTISFGLNDLTRLSEEQFGANLETLVARCRDAKCQVVLCTPNNVITTPGRPIEKLQRFCDVIRTTGKTHSVPICDQFADGEAFRAQDAWAWRLTLSDAIHPNMDGHKRMARQLCRTITGKDVALDDVGPPGDFLNATRKRLADGQPVKVVAMPPLDTMIPAALKRIRADAVVEVIVWPTAGKTLQEIEQDANKLVRAAKPDLVLIAVPAAASQSSDEAFVNSYAWIMNWSLSFGQQEWDCLVVHPAVVEPDTVVSQAALIRQLVRAQNLTLLDRPAGERATAQALLERKLTN